MVPKEIKVVKVLKDILTLLDLPVLKEDKVYLVLMVVQDLQLL